MTSTSTSELVITIHDPAPAERKEAILKSIAAAFRWYAAYREDYNGDDVNLCTLAQLQEEILNKE